MRKEFLLLLLIVLMLSLFACTEGLSTEHTTVSEIRSAGTSNSPTTAATPSATPEMISFDPEEQTPMPVETEHVIEATVTPKPTATPIPVPTATPRRLVEEIALGQTISTKYYDFTLNNVEIIYQLKPKNTRGYYRYYAAENGKIYIHIDGVFYNTSKRDFSIEDLFIPKANYDNGYKYEGFVIIDDGDSDFDWISSAIACTPLTSCHYHGLIECPEIIESSDAPLYISLSMADGITYQYVIR